MPKPLYLTTSLPGLLSILQSHTVAPNDDYVLFSEVPVLVDLAANEVTLVFDAAVVQSQLTKVQYTKEWFNEHSEQGAHIAGGGWAHTTPEDCFKIDEESGFEEEDTECADQAYRAAELEAFLLKSDERAWVSKGDGVSVSFSPKDVKEVLVADSRQLDAVEGVLDETKFTTPVDVRQAGVHPASSDVPGAGIMFTDGTRILLLKRSREVDHPGSWVVPGGACEAEEDPRVTAYRETKEEVGHVPAHDVLDWYTLETPFDDKAPPQFTTFLAHVDPSVVEGFLAELDQESTGWGWFKQEEAQKLPLHPGVQILLDKVNPFYGNMKNHTAASQEELERLPVDILDNMAFGITEGVHELPLDIIKIKYEDDYRNAVEEINEGLWQPEEGIENEPIDVSLERGVYWLEDGHHRFVAFTLVGRDRILANLTIKDNPVRVLMQKRTSAAETIPELVKDLPAPSAPEPEPSLATEDAESIAIPPLAEEQPSVQQSPFGKQPEQEQPVPLTQVKQPPAAPAPAAPGAPATWTSPSPAATPAAPGSFKFDPNVLRKLLQRRTT